MDELSLKKLVLDLKTRFSNIKTYFNIESLQKSINILSKKLEEDKTWDDPKSATNISIELKRAQNSLCLLNNIENEIEDILEFINLSNGEHFELQELEMMYNKIKDELDTLEIDALMSGKFDKRGAIIEIKTGVGGQDAQDFSSMLKRMYISWANSKNYIVEELQTTYGELNGIKSTTLSIDSPYLYGNLKFESGTHRLVRLSPFNSKSKRETSFSGVDVFPIIEEESEITIDEKDLKIDVFRASGPGGQSVNTTDSAVRVTHLPTNLVVSIQNEKSQLQNKRKAIKVLKGKLLKLQEQELKDNKNELSANNTRSWGDQIRSYVLHPYKMVKDLRTKYEDQNVEKVLDGNIDEFIKSELLALTSL